jgi:hypothetical protein
MAGAVEPGRAQGSELRSKGAGEDAGGGEGDEVGLDEGQALLFGHGQAGVEAAHTGQQEIHALAGGQGGFGQAQGTLAGRARHLGHEQEEIAALDAAAHGVALSHRLDVEGDGPEFQAMRSDEGGEGVVRDEANEVAGALQGLAEREIGLDVAAAAGGKDGDAHGLEPAPGLALEGGVGGAKGLGQHALFDGNEAALDEPDEDGNDEEGRQGAEEEGEAEEAKRHSQVHGVAAEPEDAGGDQGRGGLKGLDGGASPAEGAAAGEGQGGAKGEGK